jgi:hypothetical protein
MCVNVFYYYWKAVARLLFWKLLTKSSYKKERNKRWGGTNADTIPASRPTEIVFLSFDATHTKK